MEKNKEKNKFIPVLIFILIAYFIIKPIFSSNSGISFGGNNSTFRILASTSTEKMDDKLIKYGKKNIIKKN